MYTDRCSESLWLLPVVKGLLDIPSHFHHHVGTEHKLLKLFENDLDYADEACNYRDEVPLNSLSHCLVGGGLITLMYSRCI